MMSLVLALSSLGLSATTTADFVSSPSDISIDCSAAAGLKLTIDNREFFKVSVFVDGKCVGRVSANSCRNFYLPSGCSRVVFVDPYGVRKNGGSIGTYSGNWRIRV